ncbi:Protein GVQW3 like protein [Argiope bruennichi]|uniref:Protein GVQW3 like protein n=1 Tax=Argiope bruennichi TaxID=94029 RepID=A0A8T0EP12_ARGBR|nr:Protein GVQW3 like protein [Argiope bruennichi]
MEESNGLTQQECIESPRETFGNEAPAEKTVYNWFAEFRRGRASVSDESRKGRPKSVLIPKNIDDVRKVIEEDRHVTYRRSIFGISQTAIHSILQEHLAVKKICSRWIPHNLTIAHKKRFVQIGPETKQQSTVWVFQDEPNPTKVARSSSTSKKMIACFFGLTGHIANIALEDRKTVNAKWYAEICLPKVISEIMKNNKNHRIIVKPPSRQHQLPHST